MYHTVHSPTGGRHGCFQVKDTSKNVSTLICNAVPSNVLGIQSCSNPPSFYTHTHIGMHARVHALTPVSRSPIAFLNLT